MSLHNFSFTWPTAVFPHPAELKQAERFWKSCHSSFTSALEHFTGVDDRVHIAVVHCNISRLFRLCATAYSDPNCAAGGKRVVSPPEQQCYQQAVDHLLSGLSTLGRKGVGEDLRTDIKFELSSVYFTMGQLAQDFAPSSSAGDKEVRFLCIRTFVHVGRGQKSGVCVCVCVCVRAHACSHTATSVHSTSCLSLITGQPANSGHLAKLSPLY